MAISRISGAGGSNTIVSMPTHQAGDLLIAHIYRNSLTAPTIPANWTVIPGTVGSANVNWMGSYYRVAASGSETFGTATNARACMVEVFRSDQGGPPSVGAAATGGTSSATLTYPALATPNKTDGTSMLSRAVGSYAVAMVAANMVPTGHTLGSTYITAGVSAITCRANAAITGAISTATASNGASASGYRASSIEIMDYVPPYPGQVMQTTHKEEGGSTANLVAAFPKAVTAGNAIIVSCGMYGGAGNPSSVTDSQGNTYTRVVISGYNSASTSIWWTTAASSGALTVTVDPDTSDYPSFAALEVFGVIGADVSAGNIGNTASATSGTTATSTVADTLAVAGIGVNDSSDSGGLPLTLTEPSGYTRAYAQPDGFNFYSQFVDTKINTATGTQAAAWTMTNFDPGDWSAAIAVFKLQPPVVDYEIEAEPLTLAPVEMGAAVVGQRQDVVADTLRLAPLVLSSASVGQRQDVVADALALGAPILGEGVVTLSYAVAATALALSPPVFATATIGQVQFAEATTLVLAPLSLSLAEVGQQQGVVADALILSGVVFPSANIEQHQDVAAVALVGAPISLSEASVDQLQSVAAEALTLAPVVIGQAEVGQVYLVEAEPLTLAPMELASPGVNQLQSIQAISLTLAPAVLSAAEVEQHQDVDALGIALGALVVEQATITQVQGAHAPPLILGAPGLSPAAVGQVQLVQAQGVALASPVLALAEVVQVQSVAGLPFVLSPMQIGLGAVEQHQDVTAQGVALSPPILAHPGIIQTGEYPIQAEPLVLGVMRIGYGHIALAIPPIVIGHTSVQGRMTATTDTRRLTFATSLMEGTSR